MHNPSAPGMPAVLSCCSNPTTWIYGPISGDKEVLRTGAKADNGLRPNLPPTEGKRVESGKRDRIAENKMIMPVIGFLEFKLFPSGQRAGWYTACLGGKGILGRLHRFELHKYFFFELSFFSCKV